MINYQSCSWCHTTNDITAAARLLPVFCSTCGHRADVARMQCDCGECLELRGIARPAAESQADVGNLAHGAAMGGRMFD